MLHLSKIHGRHDTLFLKECCAHLRVMFQNHGTLSQRNVAPFVGKSCMQVCHNFLKECHRHPAVKGFIFSISIAPLAMEGCFMLKGTFQNIYHTLIKGHYTLSKEYCIHSKALFWIKLSDCNMQLQTN